MKFIKENWSKLILVAFASILPIVSFAQNTPSQPIVGTTPSNPNSQGMIINPLAGNGVTSIPALIKMILTGMLQVGIPIVALAVIYCGFLFVFARGNSEKITHAKDALLYTLIGAAILLGAWAIAQMISGTVLAL